MMRRFALILLSLGGAALAQYDDYPVGQYEFSHQRIVVSPIKLMGGMDATKRDEGPKVDIRWTPNIDLQDIHYEYVLGVEGTLGIGPIATVYWGLDSVKANSFAVGAFARYYMGLASGPYAQLNLQWYQQYGTAVRDGNAYDTSGSKLLPNTRVNVTGPQVSPILGYNAIFSQHLVLETQMGFTIGHYDLQMPGGKIYTKGAWPGYPKVYGPNNDWGGFYFVQVGLGVAW